MGLQKIFEGYWVKNYSFNLLLGLTFLFVTSVAWNLYQNNQDSVERARIEARTIFQHNLAYRRWNAMHGGVYAEITEKNQPNPYLQIPNRDIVSTKGVKYTTINPFQMTRQAYDLLSKQSPSLAPINRTVSLNPLNPVNAPDEWESEALLRFEEGEHEIAEITEINGAPYMRLLTSYITEERCLKCHGYQGYEVGDIRGGMSIAVPMQPYHESAVATRLTIILTHLFLWMLGAGTIILFSNGLRKYQTAISESEEKFRIVSEFAYNFECWTGKNNEIIFISPSCERITGYSTDEYIENPQLLADIVHPDDRNEYDTHIQDPEGPPKEDVEYRILTKSGNLRWLSHNCTPIYLEGNFLGRRRSNKDITDKKRLEEQLLQSQKMECLGRFACGIAHDFNNTLSTITTFTHLLQGELDKKDEELVDYVKYIALAAKLGKNLTSNLLNFGRKQISERKAVKLSNVVDNILDILKVLTTEDIECDVSVAMEELPISADPHQIEQVLINLCTNARDAMPEGGRVSISTGLVSFEKSYPGALCDVPAGEYMMLSISDTGIGIPEQNIADVCQPFFTTKQNSKSKGTGLGLSIIENIIIEHKGFMDVESEVGKGTTFYIYLPVIDNMELSALEKPFAATDRKRNKLQGTILVAEDDELARKSLEVLLKHMGLKVILAENGKEAISIYLDNRNDIDMVILDVVLPQKNGREVYNIIKRDRSDMKVLFISGYTDDIISSKGINEGEFEFMQKPLDTEEFIEKVQHILHRQ
jgi:PAS domain S-box-containing protein